MAKRLFLSIALPDEFIKALVEWQKEYVNLKDTRWTAVENLHITVAFLGDIKEGLILDLINKLKPVLAGIKPFDLEFKEVVLAPPGRRPRMIWAVFFNSQAYIELVDKVWQAAAEFVEPEIYDKIKKFAIHITLARFRQPIYISGLKQPELIDKSFKVDKLELMESELRPDRPYYKMIEEFKL